VLTTDNPADKSLEVMLNGAVRPPAPIPNSVSSQPGQLGPVTTTPTPPSTADTPPATPPKEDKPH
jgi:hypothetical protein